MELKPGVKVLGVRPELVLGMCVVEGVLERHGYRLVVTSLLDGTHSKGSLHYKGLAFDARTRHIPAAHLSTVVESVRLALGPDWDVVLEPDHLHIELDVK